MPTAKEPTTEATKEPTPSKYEPNYEYHARKSMGLRVCDTCYKAPQTGDDGKEYCPVSEAECPIIKS